MILHEFRNSNGELALSVNANDEYFERKVKKFFKKDLNLIYKELSLFNCITKDGENYTMSTMFVDFVEDMEEK